MTQAQITYSHDIDIMVKTLHSYPLTIPDGSNHSVRAKETCYFGKQDSISAHPFELAQTSNVENYIDILPSYPFPELNLRMNMILNLNLVIQFYFLIQ